ncbi:MAG: hypothetical protein EPN85_13305 [Bacteroidetes bacterium]|nr:MAG: hypothetical protein EPN85_13305 [Bacteroidota bacterium]
MKKNLIYAVILIAMTYAACIEKPIYPSKPVIAYKDFIRYGSNPSEPDSVELVVSFTDNEGDIGLEQADTQGVYKYGNIWLVYYYDSSGTWAAFDSSVGTLVFDTFKFAYRVPPVLPEGDPAEPMKGLIYVKQSTFVKVHDTIKYVVYLYDRAGHRSDTIHTPAIKF